MDRYVTKYCPESDCHDMHTEILTLKYVKLKIKFLLNRANPTIV